MNAWFGWLGCFGFVVVLSFCVSVCRSLLCAWTKLTAAVKKSTASGGTLFSIDHCPAKLH